MKIYMTWLDIQGTIHTMRLPRKVGPQHYTRVVQISHKAGGLAFFTALDKKAALTKARLYIGDQSLDWKEIKSNKSFVVTN
jgi:hypothetical protein